MRGYEGWLLCVRRVDAQGDNTASRDHGLTNEDPVPQDSSKTRFNQESQSPAKSTVVKKEGGQGGKSRHGVRLQVNGVHGTGMVAMQLQCSSGGHQ